MQASPDKKCGQAGRMGASSQGGKLRAGKQRERANEQAKKCEQVDEKIASEQAGVCKQADRERGGEQAGKLRVGKQEIL